MKKSLCSLLTLLILSGCATAPTPPPYGVLLSEPRPAPVLPEIRKILIVPVESPPLKMSGGFLKDCDEGDLIDESYQDHDEPGIGVHPAAGPLLLVIGGIAHLISLPKAKRLKAEALEMLNEWYSTDKIWNPTRVLAGQAAHQIASANSYEVVVSEKMYSPPSLEKREVTFSMMNWGRPLMAWYRQTSAAVDLDECERQGIDVVLEIGIINYEIGPYGGFTLQVCVKLSSVARRGVGAAVRNFKYVKVTCPGEIFKNEGAGFKKIFEEVGGRLLQEDLIQVGLLPAGS